MNKNVKHQILLAIFSLAMLFSCQKNKDTEVVTKQQFQMTESAQIIYNKLVAFKKAIDNPQKVQQPCSSTVQNGMWKLFIM